MTEAGPLGKRLDRGQVGAFRQRCVPSRRLAQRLHPAEELDGCLGFLTRLDDRADLAGGELSFSVTDGAGKVSATAVRIG